MDNNPLNSTPNQPQTSEEKLPKPFPEANSAENTQSAEEIPVTANPNVKPPITEEEARLLLQQETRKTEAKLLTSERKNKKLAKTAIIIGVILCIAGVVIAVVMASMRKPETPSQEVGGNHVVNKGED